MCASKNRRPSWAGCIRRNIGTFNDWQGWCAAMSVQYNTEIYDYICFVCCWAACQVGHIQIKVEIDDGDWWGGGGGWWWWRMLHGRWKAFLAPGRLLPLWDFLSLAVLEKPGHEKPDHPDSFYKPQEPRDSNGYNAVACSACSDCLSAVASISSTFIGYI